MALDTETTTLPGTALTVEQMMPDVTFTEAGSGEQWRPSRLRQRSALVLCFLHAGCGSCHRLLTEFAEREDDLRWADAQVRAVLPEAAPSPFPVLIDPDGQAKSRLLGDDGAVPTLLVADRYMSVMQSHPAPEHDFPDVGDVVAALGLLACACE